MSERMIELHRAKLGLPPVASTATPINNAATAIREEERQLQRFIHRLQRRDDSHPAVSSAVENPNIASSTTGGPTVPTALARRMLQRQGVGYLDDTVAAIASASADRFLATVLQQAVACRERRLQGAEQAREAARQRNKHLQQYQADADDRKRRKLERDAAHETSLLTTIATAEALKKGGSASAAAAAAAAAVAAKNDADDKKKKAKKKKVSISDKPEDGAVATNGKKPGAGSPKGDGDDDSDEEMYDSIDEEEEYYQEQLGDTVTGITGDEEEDDDVLILRDLVRPLEAWNFHVTGKLGLEIRDSGADEIGDGTDGDEVDDEAADLTAAAAFPPEENGTEDGLFPAGGGTDTAPAAAAASGKADSKKSADDDGGTSSSAKRKSAPSPVPPS